MCEEKSNAEQDVIRTERLRCCLGNVIALLATASSLLVQAIEMPFADPDDPVWAEFQKRPYIDEAIDVFGLIFDAEKNAKKTLESMAETKLYPDDTCNICPACNT